MYAYIIGYAEQQLLKHNRLRKQHGSGILELDDTLEADAETYAKELAKINKDSSQMLLTHAKGTGQGENLHALCYYEGYPTNDMATCDW